MRESNSRAWGHNPAPKPFGQSRHQIWSWPSASNPRRKVTSCLGCHVTDQQTLELARSLELRSGAYHAPALPVELYQRSWRGDSNADHGLTRPALFLLSYTSETFFTKTWRRWGELHSRLSALQADALLSWLHRLVNLERKAGLEPAVLTLATSRLAYSTSAWSEQREVELASSCLRPEAPAAIRCSRWREMKDSNPRTWIWRP